LAKKKPTKAPVKTKKPINLADWKVITVLSGIFLIYLSYQVFLAPNVLITPEKYKVYIHSHKKASDIGNELEERGVLGSSLSFRLVAYLRGYTTCGTGLLDVYRGWSNWQLISQLKMGYLNKAKEIKVPKLRNRYKLFEYLRENYKLRVDSLNYLCRDSAFLESLGNFNKSTIYCLFLPGVYYMDVENEKLTARSFIQHMYNEYLFFWNPERLAKAKEIDLSPEQVSILASIVYSETKNEEEMPMIAEVYINRLEKDMKLESDPTVIYATRDFDARRVYNKHKQKDSPYNTYKYKGLPPGPIYITPREVIDAVLNHTDHDYIYFCARCDTSGCHNFATTYEDHKKNAEDYHNFLDQRKIK